MRIIRNTFYKGDPDFMVTSSISYIVEKAKELILVT